MGSRQTAISVIPSVEIVPPSETTPDNAHPLAALKAFGGPALLLVWLYVMANVIVFGAEVNWWLAARRARPEEAAGLA